MAFLRIIFLVLVALSLADAAFAQSLSKKSLAWQLGSDLSAATVLHVRPNTASLAVPRYASAQKAATALGVKLQPLPARSGVLASDAAVALAYLLRTSGAPIGNHLQTNYSAEHAALFEVALKSNVLLLMYGPGESLTNTIASVIRQRRTAANLPNGMTDPLLAMIARQATFEEVRNELLTIHKLATTFIGITEFSEIGESRYKAGDFAGSAASFNDGLRLDPTGPELYFGRARAYVRLDKHAEAVADYTKVIALAPKAPSVQRNLPVIYHNRGLSYGILGKNALAVADLSKAISLKPDYASAFKVRGLVYKRMGNLKLSAADLQAAESLQAGITK